LSRRDLLRATVATGVLGAVGTRPASAAGDTGKKVLRYAFLVAETGFDPAQLIDLYSQMITAHIFDGLYNYDHLARPFKIKPNTADGMPETSGDFRTWTVRVRPGIFFDDDPAFAGKPRELVAEDYVYSFKRFFDPRWKSPGYATLSELKFRGIDELRAASLKNGTPFPYDVPVEGLRTLDRYTMQFRLADPQPRLLQVLASGSSYGAVAREVVERYGDDIMAHPVGTGPFRLVEWRRSSRMVLERNPRFREKFYDAEPNDDDAEGQALLKRFRGRRLPMIDRVEVSVIEESQPRWLSFLNKEQDLQERLPNEFINVAAPNGVLAPSLAKQGVQLYRVPASDVTLTIFNIEDPVIGGYTPEKVALRRAISLGIDVHKEIRLVRKGQAIAAQSGLAPLTYGYDPSFRSENGEYDLARARALLDIYGYVDRDGDGWREMPDGSPLTLAWSTEPTQLNRQLDELRRSDMTALGIRVDFRPAKWPENMKSMRAGRLMAWSIGQSSAAPDGQPTFDTCASVHYGGQNLARFKNRKFDELYARMTVIPDGPERLQLFGEAVRLMVAYMPYKFHVHRILTDLAHPWLHGFRRAPYWLDWWQYVDIDREEQAKAIS
jgi:ABC-type transport system substrate-binding protein